MEKAFSSFSWGSSSFNVNIIQSQLIKLPIQNGAIDFDFMERFIAELEATHIAELEAYLQATGLKDYILTAEEERVLQAFEDYKFEEKNVVDVFTIRNTKSILSRDIIENSGKTPYLCASAENNAISSYVSYNEKYLDKGNCVFIGGKTFIVTYQEYDFYSNDSHNIALYLNDNSIVNKFNQLFLVTCINQSLKHKYSWGDSISNAKIKKDSIKLPIKNGKIDFDFMQTFISAMQKLVIKDVVLYSERKMTATKQVVES